MTPWSEEQITALAPDASSLTAARKLAGRWLDTGQHASALWGRCQGSGRTPYQTIVDLSGPAYKCSCPSRKFPCKHALSLLLTWASGRVDAATETADFAASWIEARPRRAAAKPAEGAPARTANPATAEQRRVRVTAGLAELEVWLGDQVRTGLANADRSFGAFEAIAARMVDAQAPGIASALRNLPTVVATRTDWPEIVLRHYARTHLLIAAHRRIDDLDPALRASVRTHIGYPNPAEAVRAEPAVRDRWMVFGRRVTEEDRLHTRRTWLFGRTTRRWALIIEQTFGSPSFAADVPPLGLLTDADLHFYPGAASLRALWGERHGDPEPFTTLPPFTTPPSAPDDPAHPARPATIAAALADHASALGRDPWLRSWPMLLAEVIPVRTDTGWYVVESDGTALPIEPSEQPWRLLGVSGGHPVTVAAEWTPDGLSPISVFTAGEVIDVAPTDPSRIAAKSAATQSSALADLTSVALVGTARRAPSRTGLAEPVALEVDRLSDDPALRLLESTALQDVYGRGGLRAGVAATPEPAADDPRPRLPRRAAERLARMMRERSAFLDEWFEAAQPHDYRAPDTLSSQLLEHAKTNAALREPLLRLAGARGSWLATRHPEWRNLVRQAPSGAAVESSDEVWHYGQPPERREWLAALRHRDAAAARETLTTAWPKESGPLKSELLGLLADGIGAADEPLLETALDDRRADVRRRAASLLTRLPDSAFAHRMRRRAGAWIRAERSFRHTELVVALPDTLDPATHRDGISDRTVEYTYRWGGGPDVTAARLRQLVAATPLGHWATLVGSPEQAVRTTVDDRFRQPIFDGWVDAALTQQDSVWARALFEVGVPSDLAMLRRRELFALLPLRDRTDHLLRLDGSWISEIEALLPAMGHPWPQPLSHHLLLLLADRAKLAARRPQAHGNTPNAHRSLLAAASVHLPVDAEGAVSIVARRCDDPAWERAFDQLAADLTHRSMMLEELQ